MSENLKRSFKRREQPAQCGKGGGGSSQASNDPNVGLAARENAETSRLGLQYNQDFTKRTLMPLLDAQTANANAATARAEDQWQSSKAASDLSMSRYKTFGIPAEDKYFKLASEYSAPGEEERQAGLARGDIATASRVAQGTMDRSMGARGLNPTSPGYTAMLADKSIIDAAATASASSKARAGARALGLSVAGDAANVGRGMNSNTLAFSGLGLQANGQSGSFLPGVMSSAQGVGGFGMQGFGLAQKGYGANLDAYTRLASVDAQNNAQENMASAQGFGSLIGAGIGAYATMNNPMGLAMMAKYK